MGWKQRPPGCSLPPFPGQREGGDWAGRSRQPRRRGPAGGSRPPAALRARERRQPGGVSSGGRGAAGGSEAGLTSSLEPWSGSGRSGQGCGPNRAHLPWAWERRPGGAEPRGHGDRRCAGTGAVRSRQGPRLARRESGTAQQRSASQRALPSVRHTACQRNSTFRRRQRLLLHTGNVLIIALKLY